jgi:hypothetical protein
MVVRHRIVRVCLSVDGFKLFGFLSLKLNRTMDGADSETAREINDEDGPHQTIDIECEVRSARNPLDDTIVVRGVLLFFAPSYSI